MEFRIAKTLEEKRASFRLRYEVYVEEFHWYEDIFPEGEERDLFDEIAVTIICLDGDTIAGMVRIIPDTHLGLPAFQHINRRVLEKFEIHSLAEGSRMIVAKKYRGTGIARKLYIFTLDTARKMGVSHFLADTLVEGPAGWNLRWIDFLHSDGFEPIAVYSYEGPCGRYISQIMIKKL